MKFIYITHFKYMLNKLRTKLYVSYFYGSQICEGCCKPKRDADKEVGVN